MIYFLSKSQDEIPFAKWDSRLLTIVVQLTRRILTERDDEFEEIYREMRKIIELVKPVDPDLEDNTL